MMQRAWFPCLLVPLLTLAAPNLLRADQCQVMEPAIAARAAALLKPGAPLLRFCEPCDETDPQPDVVSSSRSAPWDADSKLAVLLVNGEELDAAYVFVREGKGWRNLAALAGCPASGVSERLEFELPADRPARKSAPPPAELLEVEVTDHSYDGSSFGRTWKSVARVAVLAAPQKGASILAELRPGAQVAMLAMQVRVVPVRAEVVFGQGIFRPGDVFWVLDQLGELYARVYFSGKVHQLSLDGTDYYSSPEGQGCPRPARDCWAELEKPPEEELWGKVRLADGREGWIRNPGEHFEGVYEGH